MKIKKLILSNFGIYAGKHEIDFSFTTESKPIILFGGYNGRGKTTILEAILLCLYGNKSYAFTESKMNYTKYLNSYINRSDSSASTSVELIFSMEMDSTETELKLLRSWQDNGKYTKEDIRILRDGLYDAVLTDDWDRYMDYVLPVSLSQLFLFDGEKIAELVEDFYGAKLKEAIKILFGINVIEQLNVDLKEIISKNKITQALEKQNEDSLRLKQLQSLIKQDLQELAFRRADIKGKLDLTIKKLNECEEKFATQGGKLFSNQETVSKKKSEIEKELKDMQNLIYEKLAGFAPLLLVMPLICQAEEISCKEMSCNTLENEIRGIDKFIKQLSNQTNEMLQLHERFISDFDSIMKSLEKKKLGLSPVGIEQISRLSKIVPLEYISEISELIKKKNELQVQINKASEYLTIEVNQKKLKKIVEEMKTNNNQITKHQVELERLDMEIQTKTSNLQGVEQELNKITEELLTHYETQDNSVRSVKYATMARRVLDEYTNMIQQMRIKELSETITEKFMLIIGKKTLINRIVFDVADLSMNLYNDKNELVNRKKLSAGEQQLLATAIVWGITECTGQEFPFLIDTPLARLDSTHRELFLKNYIPKAGKQIIILSTDAEIIGDLLKHIEESVAQQYLLVYDEDTKSTKIQEGYFR